MVLQLPAHGADDLRTPQRSDLHRDMVILSEAGVPHASTDPESTARAAEKTHSDGR